MTTQDKKTRMTKTLTFVACAAIMLVALVTAICAVDTLTTDTDTQMCKEFGMCVHRSH